MAYTNHLKLVSKLYDIFVGQLSGRNIPIDLRAPSLVGTVQDDPFDSWVGELISANLPDLEVEHAGKLTNPDIIIRDRNTGVILGVEVKKLIQAPNGSDSRGNTIDFNSSIPCGTALIKVGSDTVEIPCFYLFALLSNDSTQIVTLILMDGDFLNYDFNLHKEAKVANISEYKHGPYGEGSVRRRAMYIYPNPLNYKLDFFFERKIVVIKKHDAENEQLLKTATHLIHREDIYENEFQYVILDSQQKTQLSELPALKDIFSECKKRTPRQRTAMMPKLEKL